MDQRQIYKVENTIFVLADDESALPRARLFCNNHNLQLLESGQDLQSQEMVLHFSDSGEYISWLSGKKRLSFSVDFIGGRAAHRRRFGGGKSQLIAKAVGLQSKKKDIEIFDCTAGQGGDAFVLACLGCKVSMMERSAVAYALLESAYDRAQNVAREEDESLQDILSRLSLSYGNASDFLQSTNKKFDVIYLDPMFPIRKKSALVKKEMQIFHRVIGKDEDSSELLEHARSRAAYRVVVKRPKGAPHLNDETPTFQLNGKSTRFDIYVNQSMDADS